MTFNRDGGPCPKPYRAVTVPALSVTVTEFSNILLNLLLPSTPELLSAGKNLCVGRVNEESQNETFLKTTSIPQKIKTMELTLEYLQSRKNDVPTRSENFTSCAY
jgi:hypothetical protein